VAPHFSKWRDRFATSLFSFSERRYTLDHDGIDLPDIGAAGAEAVETTATILREDAVNTLCSGYPLRLWVTEGPGGRGKTLFALRVESEE